METVENEKGFRVLKIDRTELLSKTARFGAVGVCDRCGHTPHTLLCRRIEFLAMSRLFQELVSRCRAFRGRFSL